jgi:hypothetical protein
VSATDAESASAQAIGWRALAGLFLVVTAVHTLSPDVQVSDSRLSVPTAVAVLEHHTLSLDDVPSVPDAVRDKDYDIVRREGHLLPFFPWPPMLLAIPGSVAADVVGVDVGRLRPSDPTQTWKVEQPTAALLVGAATVAMALLAFEVAGRTAAARRFAIRFAVVFAFATAAWSTASRALWQHTPAMACASLALLAAVRSRRDHRYLWLLGGALALDFTMRPTGAIPLVALGLWAVAQHGRASWRMAAAGFAIAVPFVLVNLSAYGDLLPPYYAGTRLGTEAAIGFGESFFLHLVSPSRGLLVYTPMFLLAPIGLWLKRRASELDALDVAVGATVVAHSLMVGTYGSTGGSSYGSRFYTEVVPYLLFLCLPVFERIWIRGAATALARRGVIVLVAMSFAMTVPGALTRASFCWSATPELIDEAPERVWDWTDPQFLRPIQRLREGDSMKSVLIGSCDTSSDSS